MVETPQQYTQRIISNVGVSNPMDVLEKTMTRLEEIVSDLEKKGNRKPAGEGKWSAVHILSHLAEGEMVFAYRLRRILSDSGQPIEAYDQEKWVANAGYLQSDPRMALSLFLATRKANVALLKSLTPEQWAHFGIHSERGEESISHMARLYAGHDINHLRQLEAL